MNRWWFLDNKKKTDETPVEMSTVPTPNASIVEQRERKWEFRVHVPQTLSAIEGVGATGECSILGDWQPQHGVFLNLENSEYFYLFFCEHVSDLRLHRKMIRNANLVYERSNDVFILCAKALLFSAFCLISFLGGV